MTRARCSCRRSSRATTARRGLIVTHELGREVAAALGEHRALLLVNHGIVAVGAVPEAVCAAILLEKAAHQQLLVEGFGGARRWSDDEEALAKRATVWSSAQLQALWARLERRLDRGWSRRRVQAAKFDHAPRRSSRQPVSAHRRRLALACWDYDRTRALSDGRIAPEGVELIYLTLSPEETFFRMLRHREFDAAELSLSSYVLSLDADHPPFVAIPVFPSRAFRHSGIYVNVEREIRQPADLAGGRVGVAEYQLTANVWIRGILAERHGVPIDSVTYVTGGLEQPGRIEKYALDLPSSIRIEPAPEGRALSELLDAGEIDAIYSPRAPSAYGNGRVVRLFEDWPAVEKDYFRDTRIFPIMHVVAIRREFYEDAPWIARSLYKAFDAALAEVRSQLHEVAALKYALPWVAAHAEEAEALMGPNPWAYGLEPNRHVLATFLRYSGEQGLARTPREPESLFVRESLESFAV